MINCKVLWSPKPSLFPSIFSNVMIGPMLSETELPPDKYIEFRLDNGDKIIVTEQQFLENYYGKP